MTNGAHMRWIKNRFADRSQNIATSGVKSMSRAISIEVPQGLVLGLILFNIFINDLDSGMKPSLVNFQKTQRLVG